MTAAHWLFFIAIAEFCIVLFFYSQIKRSHREIHYLERELTARDDAIEEILADESSAERDRWTATTLGLILKNQEVIMSTLEEVKAEQAITDANIAAVKTVVESLLTKIAAFPAPGLTAEQQTAIDEILAHAKAINASLSAVAVEGNPPAAAPAA